ncbi:MAG: GDP-mannose 4,6-dehydratase [bacterium]
MKKKTEIPALKRVLVTGGAGFIGRWVVKAFLEDTSARVYVIDDLSNGVAANLDEFRNETRLAEVKKFDVASGRQVSEFISRVKPDLCVHLAAQIVVQSSIDNPARTFESDVRGVFNLLESCRAANSRFAFMSTCMVYDLAAPKGAISESSATLPRSPYAGAKLSGEHLTISYHHAFGMPAVVMRPFNTYGPHQKATGEGGVVAIFISRQLKGEDLNIYGTGKQTRDLLYVGDCAEFVLRASQSPAAQGKILNAATGDDITINNLARLAIDSAPVKTKSKIKHIQHIHPQSEIMKLCGDATAAKRVLGWKPTVPLEEGMRRTREWISGLRERGDNTWL